MPASHESVVASSPAPLSKEKARPKTKSPKVRKSQLARRIWKHRRMIMKYIICAVLAVAVYVALGSMFAPANGTALILVCLGKWGGFTYKGLASVGSFAILHSKVG
jgi:hypothetical protein